MRWFLKAPGCLEYPVYPVHPVLQCLDCPEYLDCPGILVLQFPDYLDCLDLGLLELLELLDYLAPFKRQLTAASPNLNAKSRLRAVGLPPLCT